MAADNAAGDGARIDTARIRAAVSELLAAIGEDHARPGLVDQLDQPRGRVHLADDLAALACPHDDGAGFGGGGGIVGPGIDADPVSVPAVRLQRQSVRFPGKLADGFVRAHHSQGSRVLCQIEPVPGERAPPGNLPEKSCCGLLDEA